MLFWKGTKNHVKRAFLLVRLYYNVINEKFPVLDLLRIQQPQCILPTL